MATPVRNNPSIAPVHTPDAPSAPRPSFNTQRDTLAIAPSSTSWLSTLWESIISCFKAIFPCFFQSNSSLNDKIQAIAARDHFVWFYKKEENPLTEFLGNFMPCRIRLWGEYEFRCAEAAFQAAKFAEEPDLMRRFQNLDGEAAWRLGQQLSRHWSRANHDAWRQRSTAVMREVVYAKFNQNPDLKALLLATGNAYLVEHIPRKGRDAFWGDDSDGTGQNQLGRICMSVRGNLQGSGEVARPPQYDRFISGLRN